jgi:hypothetical protein
MEIHHTVAVNARLKAPSGILLANIPFQQQPAVEVLDRFGNVVFDWNDSAQVHLHTFVPFTKCAELPPALGTGGSERGTGGSERGANSRIQSRLHGARGCTLDSGIAQYGRDGSDGLLVDAVGSYTLKARVESLGWECVSDAFEVVRATLPPLTVVWKGRKRLGEQEVEIGPRGGVFVGEQRHKLAGIKAVFRKGSVHSTVLLRIRKLEELHHLAMSAQMLKVCRKRLANRLLYSLGGVLRAKSKFDPPPLLAGGGNTIQGDRRSYRAKARDNCMFVNLELFGAKEQAEGARLACSLQEQAVASSFASSYEYQQRAQMVESEPWQNNSEWEIGGGVDRIPPQGCDRPSTVGRGSATELRLELPQLQRASTAPAGQQTMRQDGFSVTSVASISPGAFSAGPVAGPDMAAVRTATMRVDPLMMKACQSRVGAAKSVAKVVGTRALRTVTTKRGVSGLDGDPRGLRTSQSVGESRLSGGSSILSSGFAAGESMHASRFSRVSAHEKFTKLEMLRLSKKGRQAIASQGLVPAPLPLVTAAEAAAKLQGIGSVCGISSLIRNEMDTLDASVGSWNGSWAANSLPGSFEQQYYQNHGGADDISSSLLQEIRYQKGEELAPPLLLSTLDDELQQGQGGTAQGGGVIDGTRKSNAYSRMQLMEVVGPILELHPPNLVFDKPITIRIPCANLPAVQMTAPGGGAAGTKPMAFLIPHELEEMVSRYPHDMVSTNAPQQHEVRRKRPKYGYGSGIDMGERAQKASEKAAKSKTPKKKKGKGQKKKDKKEKGADGAPTALGEDDEMAAEESEGGHQEQRMEEEPQQEESEERGHFLGGEQDTGDEGAEAVESASAIPVSTYPEELIIDRVTADYVELRVPRAGYLLVGKLVQAEFPTFSAHRKVRMHAFCTVSCNDPPDQGVVEVSVQMFCGTDREDERNSMHAFVAAGGRECGSSNGFFMRKGETVEVALQPLTQADQLVPTDGWEGGADGGLLRRSWEWNGVCEHRQFNFTLSAGAAQSAALQNGTTKLRAAVSQIPPPPNSLETSSSSPVGPGRVAASLMSRIRVTEFQLQIPVPTAMLHSPTSSRIGTIERAVGALPIAIMSGGWEGKSTSIAAGSMRRPTPTAPNSIDWSDTVLQFTTDPDDASILISGTGYSLWKGKRIGFGVTGSIAAKSPAADATSDPLLGAAVNTLPMVLRKKHTDARYHNAVDYEGTLTLERKAAAVETAGDMYLFVISCSSSKGGLVVSRSLSASPLCSNCSACGVFSVATKRTGLSEKGRGWMAAVLH